jgi:chaperonin GroES
MTHRIIVRPQDLIINDEADGILSEITPLSDNVIIRVVDNEAKSTGGIVLTKASVEKSTLGVVLLPNTISYNRDGSTRKPVLKMGDIVRLQRGTVGTGMPEAPEGENWIAAPEDCIYYYRRLIE